MATLLLSAAGAAIGGSLGGTVFGLSTAVIGRAVGATLGRVIDQRLMGGGSQVIETGKIERFQLTGASEGTAIGTHYGRVRTGGQVIWSTRFKERIRKDEVGGKGGGPNTTTKTYSYSISLAVALCEGEILDVGRVWADGMEVSRTSLNMRVYKGSEEQLPDPKIAAVEGAGNAPAYRGLAYVVFENLQLAAFGNRVPQFSFEVLRAADPDMMPENEMSLAQTIRAVAMIPGTGEYSLATSKVNYANDYGWSKPANRNTNSGKTDFLTSLDHLGAELPECNSVSLVVSWFGDDLRCGNCTLKPKVEQRTLDGNRMPWQVSGLSRETAETLPRIDGRSVYGGTPADASVVEAIRELKKRGKSVVFYPFILMEQMDGNGLADPWSDAASQPSFPWRGRITTENAPGRDGSSDQTETAGEEVASFFGNARASDFSKSGTTVAYVGGEEWSFRRFILHYAHLCALAGGVDAFCIGSEMRGLTQIRAEANRFPAVEEMVTLAADVRAILGPEAKISYAADWSEYFGYHPQDGSGDVFFHLDPLWASDDIDFIGIDNYMPVSDWRDSHDHADAVWRSVYDLDYLKANIAGGEGFDWYYADEAGRISQDRLPITDGAHGEPWIYRYKDLHSWWSLPHHNRVGGVRQAAQTAWQPQSKPFWFAEIGCAAVDKGTNQPNKFVDAKSSESGLPWFSTGSRDDFVQMQYLRALFQYWNDPVNNPASGLYAGRMVEIDKAHVWAWDARPYPDFPARSGIWSDGGNYTLGHWLNGRASSESLAAVVADICGRAGLTEIDVSELYGVVRGYSVDETAGARAALQTLSLAFGFDVAERDGKLTFRSRNGIPDFSFNEDELVSGKDPVLSLQRASSAESVGKVRMNYVRADGSFETRTVEASLPDEEDQGASNSDLAICLTGSESRRIAERWLAESRVARDTASFALPLSAAGVQTGDIVALRYGEKAANFRVDRVETADAIRIEAMRVEADLFKPSNDVVEQVALPEATVPSSVFVRFLDLPLIDGSIDPVAPYLATTADPWPGSVAVYSAPEDDGYSLNRIVEEPAVVGETETALAKAASGLPDLGARLRVKVFGGTLASATRTALLNGVNALAISDGSSGDWEVLQFGTAELVDEDTYELGYLLRGQLGTDAIIPEAWAKGSTVVLLDGAPTQVDMPPAVRGLERHYRVGPSSEAYSDESFVHLVHTARSVGYRPYRPAHLRAVAEQDGSTQFTWIRRSRIDGDSWEGTDVPLGEDSERYLVRVLQGETIIREEEVGQTNWHYSTEKMASDGLVGSYVMQVAQISERYGAGPFQRIEING